MKTTCYVNDSYEKNFYYRSEKTSLNPDVGFVQSSVVGGSLYLQKEKEHCCYYSGYRGFPCFLLIEKTVATHGDNNYILLTQKEKRAQKTTKYTLYRNETYLRNRRATGRRRRGAASVLEAPKSEWSHTRDAMRSRTEA